MKWVTRERPQVDRIACPWLIKRFVEAGAHTTAFDQRRQRLYVFQPSSCRTAVYDEVDDRA